MYENIGQGNALGIGNVGGFAAAWYWSSTEYVNLDAWSQYFLIGGGGKLSDFKGVSKHVRAVRAF